MNSFTDEFLLPLDDRLLSILGLDPNFLMNEWDLNNLVNWLDNLLNKWR